MFYAVRPLTQPASLVRGSSRRITIVRFRPADIRVINRRICLSPCPRVCVRTPLAPLGRRKKRLKAKLDKVTPY